MSRFKQYKTLDPSTVIKKLEEFYKEDRVQHDITTLATHQANNMTKANFIAKEDLIFAGNAILLQGLKEATPLFIAKDGATIQKGKKVASFIAPVKTVLSRERVLLNLIQRLSGIATKTKILAKKLKPYNIELLDTRKTTPGLREFEKFAIAVGGGTNHRFSLEHAVMIKDNHLVNNNITQLVDTAHKNNPDKEIQVEVDTICQLEEALETKATAILLDNFQPKEIPGAIQRIRKQAKNKQLYIELSGGINENNLQDYCIQGVNGISIGALTHNIKSKDISLDLEEIK